MDPTDTIAADSQPRRLARAVLAGVLFGGAGLVTAHAWLGVGGDRLDFALGGPVYDSVVLAAGIACLLRALALPRERAAWLVIGVSILFWAAGEIYWTAFVLDEPTAPYPSPADVGYLGFYPLAVVGLALLIRARARELDWRLWTDGLIAALGTAALGTAFVFEFVADRTAGTGLETATSLAYPLGDIVLVSLVVGAVALTGWRPDRTWSLLLAGLAATGVADVAYTLQSTGGVLPAGNWVDPIYLISAALLGAVLWQPTAGTLRPATETSAWRELVVPALFATVMIGLFLMHYLNTASVLSTTLWTATMVVVIARLGSSVRENKALLEQVQTDELTGLGNRARMQIELDRLAANASEERPVALLFLDLNGFKHYNDTFGHPAGDALLTRLGHALRGAVGDDGHAYRVGGDEFCVLLTCEAERFDLAASRAVEALTAKGGGFEVDPSSGLAKVPMEAATPLEALRLADVRMYAQKESRRVARDPDGSGFGPLSIRGQRVS